MLTFRPKNLYLITLLLYLLSTGCGIFKPSPKTAFVDGTYTQISNNTARKVFVDMNEDSLFVHPYSNNDKGSSAPSKESQLVLPYEILQPTEQQSVFSKSSYDIDFITIPLKYRFAQKSVPPQLNANLTGAIYLGYRTDRYAVKYHSNPLQKSLRNITHFGFSVGVYTGLGNTFMSPTNTGNQIDQEYDGLIWTKGIAGIIGLNSFTIGLTLGFDNLLDRNRKVWIYESKPYIGFALGLNLN
jgi:hypothetical protein